MALAAETIQTVERMSWRKDAEIQAAQTFVKIPIRDASEAGRETPALGLGSGSVVDKIYARERELVEQERAKRPVIPCEVQAIRIGDLGIVTNGAEFFCQLGLDIKAASPFARTWVVSLANDWIGYVADAVGVLCRRLRAADRPERQDGALGRAIARRRIAGRQLASELRSARGAAILSSET